MNKKKSTEIISKNIVLLIIFSFIALIFILKILSVSAILSLDEIKNVIETETNIEITINPELSSYNINYKENILKFEIEKKAFKIYLKNQNIDYENSINLPKKITLDFEILENKKNPKIIFYGEKNNYSIIQKDEGTTNIYFEIPEEIKNKSEIDIKNINNLDYGIIYLVEHYEPDLRIDDSSRLNGKKILSINMYNNPKILFNDSKIVLFPNELKISKKSFEYAESLENSEINIINNNTIKRIYKKSNLTIIENEIIKYDKNYDRGFTSEQDYLNEEKIQEYSKISNNHNIVDEESCNKFIKFKKNIIIDNEFLNIYSNENKNNSWELYVINQKRNINNDESIILKENLDKIIELIKQSNGKKFIIKIDKNTINLFEIIKHIYNNLDTYDIKEKNKEIFFVIIDKPNSLEKEADKEIITSEDYINLLKNIYNEVSNNINIIISPLEQSKEKIDSEKIILNSKDYYETIFKNEDIINPIKYIAISINTSQLEGLNYCINLNTLYNKDYFCIDSIYAHRVVLDIAKIYNKELKAIILIETQNINESFIEELKSDPYVEAVFLDKEVC
ncbi:MAG: hypothetical protein QXE31_03175 [Candidatus Woesearchaeota archaeon]